MREFEVDVKAGACIFQDTAKGETIIHINTFLHLNHFQVQTQNMV